MRHGRGVILIMGKAEQLQADKQDVLRMPTLFVVCPCSPVMT